MWKLKFGETMEARQHHCSVTPAVPRLLRRLALGCAIFATAGASVKPALAQDNIDLGVKKYYDLCAVRTSYLRNLHDCHCLSEGYRKVLTASGRTQIAPEEQYQIGQTCPAPKATTYDWVYKTCDDFMQHRRTDHAQFCGCTAERFSTTFHNQPNSNLRKVEALRAESMKACGVADRSHNLH